ncbi:MAG: 7-cyano-7-deazaguanine synthase QueC [Lentisphaeria bacterium]|nr:7-cyano-7-deazaguanine synthase QueC [Lentisphaeria bacterium]
MDKQKAVILLSGGLDSATCLAIAQSEGYDVYGVTFDYGQRHNIELDAAKRIADRAGIPLLTIRFDMRLWGGSALTSDEINVPHGEGGDHETAPVTYVPARNLIFLSFGVSYAETLGAKDIFIGVNSMDYSGYPDCRDAFVKAFQQTATLGTKAIDENWQFNIHAPLQYMKKSEIITRGMELGVDYSMTHSCYSPDPDGFPCEECDSCTLRIRAFAELGMRDPALRKR